MFIKILNLLTRYFSQQYSIMTSSIFGMVEGIEGRMNLIVHQSPQGVLTTQPNNKFEDKKTFQGHVVFFPGDIQDFSENMKSHHVCVDFIEHSYENTIKIISEKFPHSHIWLVVPSKKAYNTICIYKNFVPSESLMGVPSINKSFNGLLNLEKLMDNAVKKLNPENVGNFDVDNCLITLLAFSKGSVVLNQFLYEISETENQINPKFVDRIKAMFWLDGGHSGEENVWITDPEVISNLTPLKNCKFYIHMTPYQVRDQHRPWKGETEREFAELMRENEMLVEEKLHFEELEPSLELHFKVLKLF